jgi:hypothetical protein
MWENICSFVSVKFDELTQELTQEKSQVITTQLQLKQKVGGSESKIFFAACRDAIVARASRQV